MAQPTPSPSPIQSPSTELSPPLKESGDYSGALWEIGDFLFAARSIAKIAHGKGGWGDAFNVGITAASVFLPPLKLGRLAEPALKAVVAESEKMLATDVVSVVGKKQLEKNINNAQSLLNTVPEDRMVVASRLEAERTAISRQGGIPTERGTVEGGVVKPVNYEALGERPHPMPPENIVEAPKELSIAKETNYPPATGETVPRDLSEWLQDSKKAKKYVSLKNKLLSGAIKRRDLTSEEQRVLEVFDHYRNPKNRQVITLTDSAGNKYKGFINHPFKESVEPEMFAGGAEKEFSFADFWEEKLAELDDLLVTKKQYESKIEALVKEIEDPKTNAYLVNVLTKQVNEHYNELGKLQGQDKELMNWLRGTYKKYMDNATADNGLTDMSEVTFNDSNLSKDVIEQIKGKVKPTPESRLAKPAEERLSSEAAKVRKEIDKEDEAFQTRRELNGWEYRDIATQDELAQSGMNAEPSRMMSEVRIEDFPEGTQEAISNAPSAFTTKAYRDANKEVDLPSEFLMEEAPVTGSSRLSELRNDLKDLTEKKAKLSKLIEENPQLGSGKQTQARLRKLEKQIKEAAVALKKASPKLSSNIDNIAAGEQQRHIKSVGKSLAPKIDIPGYGGTAPKTMSLLDRIAQIDGYLSANGRLNIRKKMLAQGMSEEKFFAQMEKYEKQLEKLQTRLKLHDDKFKESLKKLDDKSKARLSSWVDSLSEEKLMSNARKSHKTFHGQKDYLRKLYAMTDDTETRKRIIAAKDKLDIEDRMDLRKTLSKRTPLQEEQLAKATGSTRSKTQRQIERKVDLLEAERIMEEPSKDIIVHSGGANGADTAWAEAADKVGIPTQAHSFVGHESSGTASGFVGKRPALETRNILSKEQIKEQTPLVKAAQKVIYGSESVRTDTLGGKLVHRNAYQVKDSDAVLAVVNGFKKIHDGSRMTVGGTGTPWAVEMGIILKKPVFAFEQGAGKWFKFNPETKVWDELDGLPPKFKSFAGIGTAKDLKPSGRKAIEDYVQQLAGKSESSVSSAVKSFRGEHSFLSNMHPSPIEIDGITYPTLEHAFQAAKTTNKSLRAKIANAKTPAEAKSMGRKLKLRSDWDSIRLKTMEYLVRQKFKQNPELVKKLIDTKSADLIEGNTWGDKFWGQVDDVGQNHLGKILMKIRSEFNIGSVVRVKDNIPDAINIGRSGKFGNPFKVGNGVSVEEAVRKYRSWLWDKIKSDSDYAKEIYNLKGKTLACPGGEANDACHGQVILKAIKYLEQHPELMKGK